MDCLLNPVSVSDILFEKWLQDFVNLGTPDAINNNTIEDFALTSCVCTCMCTEMSYAL